ncbi:hypothetical protein QOT17_011461 [Balamuthia mandrillaris]
MSGEGDSALEEEKRLLEQWAKLQQKSLPVFQTLVSSIAVLPAAPTKEGTANHQQQVAETAADRSAFEVEKAYQELCSLLVEFESVMDKLEELCNETKRKATQLCSSSNDGVHSLLSPTSASSLSLRDAIDFLEERLSRYRSEMQFKDVVVRSLKVLPSALDKATAYQCSWEAQPFLDG